MTILVCGSRSWTDRGTVRNVLHQFPRDTVIVHGAARGADSVADEVARELGFTTQRRYPITSEEWRRIGKSAGPQRNRRMLRENPDISMVLAFVPERFGRDMAWVPMSRGTANMVNEALKAGLPVRVVHEGDE